MSDRKSKQDKISELSLFPEQLSPRDGKQALFIYGASVVGSLSLIGGLAFVSVM